MRKLNASDKRICYGCDSDKTYISKTGTAKWLTNKPTNLFLCKKCYMQCLWRPFLNAKWHPITSKRRIRFKGKDVQLKQNPRKGICSWCHKKGKTHMHHIEYHEDDVLKDTIELCQSCHMKETWRLRLT